MFMENNFSENLIPDKAVNYSDDGRQDRPSEPRGYSNNNFEVLNDKTNGLKSKIEH